MRRLICFLIILKFAYSPLSTYFCHTLHMLEVKFISKMKPIPSVFPFIPTRIPRAHFREGLRYSPGTTSRGLALLWLSRCVVNSRERRARRPAYGWARHTPGSAHIWAQHTPGSAHTAQAQVDGEMQEWQSELMSLACSCHSCRFYFKTLERYRSSVTCIL